MILRKETETLVFHKHLLCLHILLIRMNDTPQGDGNVSINSFFKAKSNIIRMNDTP